MEMIETPSSSNVAAIGYDAESSKMQVRFKSGGTYSYAGVQQEAFDAARNAESVGKYIAHNIKGNFPSTKIEA